MKGCDIFCICHERQSILATIQPASQAGLCGFFKVALLKKKTKLLLIYLHTHTHTELFHLYTGASCGSWGEFALWPWVQRFGGLSHQPARSGWASCFLLHIHTAVTNTHTHIQAALGNVYYVGSAWTCSAGKHMEAEMCGRVMCCSPAGRISECEEERLQRWRKKVRFIGL